MIRIDAMWLAANPIDMLAGPERLLARVVQVFGAAQSHHGYLFANARGTRVKLLVHVVCCQKAASCPNSIAHLETLRANACS
jgi:transposase